jgi:DNA-binding protein Alba
VYIGRKPPMNYVTAVITSFTRSDSEDVTLKARGRSIKTAVDAAEITRRRFMKDMNIGKIKIGTEELPQQEGGTKNVSTIEITLTRSPPEKKVAEEEKGDIKTESVPVKPMELTSIVGVGAKRAEELKSHGIQSVQDLAKLDAKQLSEKLKISEKRITKWIDEAKEILKK